MCETLDDHEGSVSIGGRLITNFRFADDIVVNAEEEEEAGRLDATTTRYKMEIGPDKTRYLGTIISNEGSKPEILSKIAQTIAEVHMEGQEHLACF